MPELAEVARLVHHLRRTLTSQTISSVNYPSEDPIIFQTPKTGLTISAFADVLKGKKVLDAQQQGKYFWLVMDSPPHPLMHLGMTGWMRFRGAVGAGVDYRVSRNKRKNRESDEAAAAAKKKTENGEAEQEDVKQEEDEQSGADEASSDEWPPRFWKWGLTTTSDPPVEAAFVDGRRLARVRLLDVPASELRNTTPLKENGPDPVVDSDKLTFDFVKTLANKRKKPIKSLLLDQGVISGIGNWMADEILYQAALHPEQYANTLSDEQVGRLHREIVNVCKTAVDALADSSLYPEGWLMKFRWDKGKKEANRLPSGERIVHITVGGRTSAIVPTRQRKTGPVAGDVEDGVDGEDEKVQKSVGATQNAGKKSAKRRNSEANQDEQTTAGQDDANAKKTPKKKSKSNKVESAPASSSSKRAAKAAADTSTTSRRSSRRQSGK